MRFNSDASERTRRSILAKHKLQVRRTNAYVPDQVVVAERSRKVVGTDLLEVANSLAEMDEVHVATPNFVSEYRREAAISVPPRSGTCATAEGRDRRRGRTSTRSKRGRFRGANEA